MHGREHKLKQSSERKTFKNETILENLEVEARTILKRILKKWYRWGWTGFVWLRTMINGELLLRTVMNLRAK
jgi:hypothetical protein